MIKNIINYKKYDDIKVKSYKEKIKYYIDEQTNRKNNILVK